MYFEICALLVTSYADLEESTFEVDYDVHSIVLTVSVSRCMACATGCRHCHGSGVMETRYAERMAVE